MQAIPNERSQPSQPLTVAGWRRVISTAPLTVAPNNSFKPKTNRCAIVFGLIQALGGTATTFLNVMGVDFGERAAIV